MSYTLVQAGSGLQSLNGNGAISTPLTLPASVTVSPLYTPRFARFKQYLVMVNSCSRPVSIDQAGTVRLLTPLPPTTPLVLSGVAGGSLTGTYLARQTYIVLDPAANVIAESDYGPLITNGGTVIAAKYLKAANINLSPEAVTGARIYRTTSTGAVYFSWISTDSNTVTAVQDDLSDAGLPTVSGPTLGTAPDLTLICEWKGRLWGVGRTDIDNLRYTEAGTMYAWGALNTLPIAHVGADAYGITALIPRKNALGVAKKNTLTSVTGTATTNFMPSVIGEQVGCDSQESVEVFNDTAYWLWRDGVYQWDSNGVQNITDGAVRTWFTTGTYFNRAMFPRAFGEIEPETLKYRLYLAAAGTTALNRWIEYDLQTKTWWGPHKTDAFTPTSKVTAVGADGHPYAMVGSLEGYLSMDTQTKSDWGLSPIVCSLRTKSYGNDTQQMEKLWSNLTIFGKIQPSGTVNVVPTVGELEGATAQSPMLWDLTLSRHRLPILGAGKFLTLEFDTATLNEDFALLGFDVPYTVIGER